MQRLKSFLTKLGTSLVKFLQPGLDPALAWLSRHLSRAVKNPTVIKVRKSTVKIALLTFKLVSPWYEWIFMVGTLALGAYLTNKEYQEYKNSTDLQKMLLMSTKSKTYYASALIAHGIA